MRLNFSEFGILLALMASGRSEDVFYTSVGGVAFGKNKRILAVCYNGFAPGQELSNEFLKDRDKKNGLVFHSEVNLLAQCKAGEIDTIFLTHSPCENCARLIAANQVKNVIFLQEYHRESKFKEIFEFYKINWRQINKTELLACAEFLSKVEGDIRKVLEMVVCKF